MYIVQFQDGFINKTIKYAGIAGATLLALSPMITPIFTITNTVKADVVAPDKTTVENLAKGMGENLSGQALMYDFANNPTLQSSLDAGFQTAIDKNETDGSIFVSGVAGISIKELGNSTPWNRDQRMEAYQMGSGIYSTVKIYDPDGNQVKTAAELDAAISSDSTLKGYTADIGLAYANDASGNSYTEVDAAKGLKIIDLNAIKSASINWDAPDITVQQGSKVSDIDTSNMKFTVVDGNGVQFGKSVQFIPRSPDGSESEYYENLDDARTALSPISSDVSGDTSDTFDKVGTFYVLVDIYTSSMAENYIEDYRNPSIEANVSLDVNGEVVSKNQVAQASQNIKIGGESSGDVLLQKIIVTPKPSSNSNTGNGNTSISGIVTTHTDKGSYSLYNDDNQKVDNRALVKSSSWKVDGIRTVDGVKQYRVSTHEWVNASDVDFTANGEVTEGMTIQNLDTPKEITLSNRHVRYNLQDSNKVVSTTRALAGGTSWLVDKIGTDMHGGIYYGVSTNEFVKADDGVSVVK
ncbi:hypothetical protein [Companilactobacillus baiquanensis]|uniref:Surface layer protein A domain-containing protein n=1 Tax=Companilactobacillus baiquanensis TaxID=2486005 RepID=A0ABW1UV99_9LACO|nr:hypothetical protein [Companilactobacillus baiquanensis]